jgi:hypothetical protein
MIDWIACWILLIFVAFTWSVTDVGLRSDLLAFASRHVDASTAIAVFVIFGGVYVLFELAVHIHPLSTGIASGTFDHFPANRTRTAPFTPFGRLVCCDVRMDHLTDDAIEAYITGNILDEAEVARIEEHYRACDACVVRLEQSQGFLAATRAALAIQKHHA